MEDNENFFSHQVFALSLKCPGAISYFSDHLPPEDVGKVHGQTGIHEFYLALLDFYRQTGLDPIDVVAFKSWLENETEICAALGGMHGVEVFIETFADVELSNPESVVAIVRHRATKRRQIDNMQELQLLVSSKAHKSEDDKRRIRQLTEEIRSLEEEIGYDPLADVVTAQQMAKDVDKLWELPDFIPTPYKSLNRALGYSEDAGMCRGALHGVLARSGLGKSTFVKTLTNHWVDGGYTVLYVNYEEARAHWERVLFTQVTKQNIYKAKEISESDHVQANEVFSEKMERWGNRLMVKHDPETPYFDDLEKWLRDMSSHQPPDVVVIDTLQSMFMKGSGGKPRWGQFEEMMVRLEKLAKDMNAVFVITAQENSNRMREGREVVQQSDAGGSLTIVQKCAITIFITEKRMVSGDDSDDPSLVVLQIPKNRITGQIFSMDSPILRYDDESKSFYEVDPPKAENYVPYVEIDNESEGALF